MERSNNVSTLDEVVAAVVVVKLHPEVMDLVTALVVAIKCSGSKFKQNSFHRLRNKLQMTSQMGSRYQKERAEGVWVLCKIFFEKMCVRERYNCAMIGREEKSSFSRHLSFIQIFLNLLSFGCEGRVDGEGGAVEVDIDPAAVPPVPYSSLLRLLRVRMTLFVDELSDPNVCDCGGVVTQEVYVGVDDVHVAIVTKSFQIVKIKLVKFQSFD